MHIQLLRYLPILGFALVLLWLLFKKWDFVKEILSETTGGKSAGSATRTGGMILILVVAFNECYTTMRTQKFDYDHLVALLVGIGVQFGLVKIVDLFSVWKGGRVPSEPQKTDQPSVTTTTTTEVKS